jgi:hypothetical protein
MKKYKGIIIYALVVVLLSTLSTVFYYKVDTKQWFSKKETPKEDKTKKLHTQRELVASKIYENTNSKYSFSMVAIFDDGTIYTWNNYTNDRYDDIIPKDSDLKNVEKVTEFIIKVGTKNNKSVTSDDLAKIKDKIDSIDNNIIKFERKHTAVDTGSYSIYCYKNDTAYLLADYGDWTGSSDDLTVQELLALINKYIIGLY